MKQIRLIISCVLCFIFIYTQLQHSNAQAPDSLWQYPYGGAENERGFAVMEDDDGIYLVAGSTKSSGNGDYDAYLLKLDNNGSVIWEKTYGGSLGENIASLCPALYGGYVLAGYTATDAQGLSDIWILLVSAEGDSLHSAHFGGETSDQANCIIPNYDQGYTVASRTSVYTMGDQIYLMKLDLALDTLWTKTYGESYQDYGYSIIQVPDGGYVVAGSTYSSYTSESGDAWVLRTDSVGDTLWTKKYGGNNEDIFYAVAETEDGYIFAGQTRSFNAVVIDVYVVRTNFDGEIIWSKYYGGNMADYAYSIFRSEDNNFIIAGYSGSFNENDDVYLFEIDGEGEVLWQDHYGISEDSERMYGSSMTSDGGMILTGIMDYYWQLQDDLFVLKLVPGSTGFRDQQDRTNGKLYVCPNPVMNSATLQYSIDKSSRVTLSLYDAEGRAVACLFSGIADSGDHSLNCDFSSFQKGIYYLKLCCDEVVQTCKLITLN